MSDPEPATPSDTGRLPRFTPAELDPDQRAVYDSITTGPRASAKRLSPITDERGRLEGPFNAMLLSPRLGLALQEVGASIRYRTSPTDRERELAILLVSVAHTSDFEWLAHVAVGRAAGLTDIEIAAILDGSGLATFAGPERVVVEVVASLVDQRDLDDELFERATASVGLEKLVELVYLVGYYQLLSLGLRVFRVPLPTGEVGQWHR